MNAFNQSVAIGRLSFCHSIEVAPSIWAFLAFTEYISLCSSGHFIESVFILSPPVAQLFPPGASRPGAALRNLEMVAGDRNVLKIPRIPFRFEMISSPVCPFLYMFMRLLPAEGFESIH